MFLLSESDFQIFCLAILLHVNMILCLPYGQPTQSAWHWNVTNTLIVLAKKGLSRVAVDLDSQAMANSARVCSIDFASGMHHQLLKSPLYWMLIINALIPHLRNQPLWDTSLRSTCQLRVSGTGKSLLSLPTRISRGRSCLHGCGSMCRTRAWGLSCELDTMCLLWPWQGELRE